MILETVIDPGLLAKDKDNAEMNTPINEDMQAMLNQLGPGINDEKAANCISTLLQETYPETSYVSRHVPVSQQASTLEQSYFDFDDANAINQLGPRVDDEILSAYMQHVLG